MIAVDWKCGKKLGEGAFSFLVAGLLGLDFNGAPFDDNDFDVSNSGNQLTISPGFALIKNRFYTTDSDKPPFWIVYSDADINYTVPLNDSGVQRVDALVLKVLRSGSVTLNGIADNTVVFVDYIVNDTGTGVALSDVELELRIPNQYDYLRLADITVPNNSDIPTNIANVTDTVLAKLRTRMGL